MIKIFERAATCLRYILPVFLPLMCFAQSGTLPVLHINTVDNKPITSKTVYLPGSYWIEPNGLAEAEGYGSAENPLQLEIKGRGNSSWKGEKKPYKIKLATKTPLLGMPKNKHWALMKYYEPNTAGMLLGEALGMPWTAHQRPIEVVLNDKYVGLYELTETNRIGKNRVDIWEQPDLNENPETVGGGWLVEVDNYSEPNQIKIQEPGCIMRVTYHSPGSLSTLQLNWLKNSMQDLCDAIYDTDKTYSRWEDMMDVEAIAKYFIVSEVMDNPDAFHGSFWLHHDYGEGEKWVAGPLWDIACAQRLKTNYTFRMKTSYTFTPHLIKGLINDPEFCHAVRQAWQEFYPYKANEWLEDIEARFDYPEALEADYNRWKPANRPPQQERVETLRYWLSKNLAWFNAHLPGTTTNIGNIEDQPYENGRMYDLSGRRVTGKAKGIFIVNGRKVIVR